MFGVSLARTTTSECTIPSARQAPRRVHKKEEKKMFGR